jgi:hypothetical protein
MEWMQLTEGVQDHDAFLDCLVTNRAGLFEWAQTTEWSNWASLYMSVSKKTSTQKQYPSVTSYLS